MGNLSVLLLWAIREGGNNMRESVEQKHKARQTHWSCLLGEV